MVSIILLGLLLRECRMGIKVPISRRITTRTKERENTITTLTFNLGIQGLPSTILLLEFLALLHQGLLHNHVKFVVNMVIILILADIETLIHLQLRVVKYVAKKSTLLNFDIFEMPVLTLHLRPCLLCIFL